MEDISNQPEVNESKTKKILVVDGTPKGFVGRRTPLIADKNGDNIILVDSSQKEKFDEDKIYVVGDADLHSDIIRQAKEKYGDKLVFITREELSSITGHNMPELTKPSFKNQLLEDKVYKYEMSPRMMYDDLNSSKAHANATIVPVRTEPKIGRNDPCPCGSKLKYKNCCLKK